MSALEQITGAVASALWGRPLVAALLGTHVFLTFRLRGVQRYIGKAIRLSVRREKGVEGGVSPFSALMTSLAATIGTGNVVGVATAVAAGGPGAVLWMWISGLFGMATKYAEALLSVKYRVRRADGSFAGGPMVVMERALHLRPLGCVFAFFTAAAALGVGGMVQSNSAAGLLDRSLHIPPLICGLALAGLGGCVIIGGIGSIARVCRPLIPAAGGLFVAANLFILLAGWQQIPRTLLLIGTSAFTGQAAVGGFTGAMAKDAVRYGIARGLFSNEAGLGSSPIVDAAARCGDPARQALVSSSGVFWDTVVMAALTGVMIVNTGLWRTGGDGGELIGRVFGLIPAVGPALLGVSLFLFAFATIIGWSYYAESAVRYLFGERAVRPYQLLYLILTALAPVLPMTLVWNLSDIANAMMALPNLFSLLLLNGTVREETRRSLWSGRLFRAEGLTKSKNPPGTTAGGTGKQTVRVRSSQAPARQQSDR